MDTALAQCLTLELTALGSSSAQLPTALGPSVHFRPMLHCLHYIIGKLSPTQNIVRRIEGVKCKLFTGSLLPNKHSVIITACHTKLFSKARRDHVILRASFILQVINFPKAS